MGALGDRRVAVVDLQSVRPIWRVADSDVLRVREAFGDGWSVVHIDEPVSSDGDGSGASPSALRAVVDAEVYVGFGVSPEIVSSASGLRWVHSAATGVGSAAAILRGRDIVLTNSRGIAAEPIADWTVAAVGYCVRGFHFMVQSQRARRWAKDEFTDHTVRPREFADIRIGIFGLGGIGEAVSRRCSALGMQVAAIRRRPDRGSPPGVSLVGGMDRLEELAARSDVLVICAPLTEQTRGSISAAVLAAMPRGAYVINVARGEIVDENALLAALDSGSLGGCVLDVFEHEPLANDSPFWDHPLVAVSPHVSAVSDRFWEREISLLVDNIGLYLNGSPLRCVVDLVAGY